MDDINLGYLFNKKYYKDVPVETWTKLMKGEKVAEFNIALNSKILEQKISDFPNYIDEGICNKNIELKTIYPGVLIGSGYQHETGAEGEFKIGFHFDYTTGLPIIPGSSIKGMLRSAFPGNAKTHKDERKKYIKEIICEILDDSTCNIDIESLEKQIFDGIDLSKKRIPVYKRDIFFEAFPFKSNNNEKIFLSDDYITPHKNPLENPKPIKFLKILPDVEFRFQFRLNDFNEQITAEVKKDIFKKIILDMGVGAKTNVGYGQFVE